MCEDTLLPEGWEWWGVTKRPVAVRFETSLCKSGQRFEQQSLLDDSAVFCARSYFRQGNLSEVVAGEGGGSRKKTEFEARPHLG